MSTPGGTDALEARALWHLELGYAEPWSFDDGDGVADLHVDPDGDAFCFDCGQLHDLCECQIGEECGRWRNGRMSSSCSKAGSEECDFECPYRSTLRF